ncbi:hypothetical protein J2W40_000032 [Sphingobium xenophagum]|uniref:Uncharacterized protein n=1 Tax=Sphingobium xenophagum TaxID=121428 RepID=A0ABU1WVB3_SPHXE|nr:hypothetical protein [Sphingobium xenophagum]
MAVSEKVYPCAPDVIRGAALLSPPTAHPSLESKRHLIYTLQLQWLDTATAPPVSQAVPVEGLNSNVQTTAYPTGGANAFILPLVLSRR